MALHWIFLGFFLTSFLVACVKFFSDPGSSMIFNDMVKATFEGGESGVSWTIALLGMFVLWLGIMRVGEKAGLINKIAWLINPFFNRVFPEIPKGHPVRGSIIMNYSANMLGLDNAATPFGLKAMGQLQEINKTKDTASNAQIMFLVLNTSGLTLIPVNVLAMRAGASDPAIVFIPLLLATYCATFVGLVTTGLIQKINLFDKTLLAYILGSLVLVGGVVYYFNGIHSDPTLTSQEATIKIQRIASLISNITLISIIVAFLTAGMIAKVNVWEAFIDGAKEAVSVAVAILPYIVGFMVAIKVFIASGTMEYILAGLESFFSMFSERTEFVESLPVAIMKPISGKGAQMMVINVYESCSECKNVIGAVSDSLVHLKGTIAGTTDTSYFSVKLPQSAPLLQSLSDTLQFSYLPDGANAAAKTMTIVNPSSITPIDCNCMDSFSGRLAATFQGSTDTTFLVLAMYFGSVGIKRIRYAAWAGLTADIAGIVAAIVVSYLFYPVQ